LQNSAFRNEFEGLDTSKSNGLQRNSLLSRTGNFCQGTGNLHAANRKISAAKSRSPPDEVFDQAGIINRAAANGGVPSPSSRTTDHRAGARQGGPVRFFVDIFGLPFDAPSYHFAPVRMNEQLDVPVRRRCVAGPWFCPRSALNRAFVTTIFNFALTIPRWSG